MPGSIIYRGPSMLDGAPIVVIALSGSTNRKTGDVVQTYILRADMAPMAALRTGADSTICGQCPHRPALAGSCYVNVGQGPTSVWGKFARGGYPVATLAQARRIGSGRMVRLGTYGDPMAVPANVWQALTRDARARVGYTHQWLNADVPEAQRAAVSAMTMASADTPSEAEMARSIGLRTFRVRLPDEPLQAGEFACPASEEAGKRKTCNDCGACNGSREGETRASPAIVAHGVVWKLQRYIALRAVPAL